MIHNYSNFINESHSYDSGSIYWKSQMDKIVDKDWYDIHVTRGSQDLIKFRVSSADEKYNYYSVILDTHPEEYYMADGVEKIFTEKFKNEFWKNAGEYIDNMKYVPQCLGDVSHVKDATKYNL